MPTPKKKATTPTQKKKWPSTYYNGIKTIYKDGMTISTWENTRGPEEHIAFQKRLAERLSEGKKDVAAAKRGDKSYSAKSVSNKQDVSTAGRLKAPKKKSTPLQKAELEAIKAGAKAAKLPGTMSKKSRNSSQMAQEFNAGYVSGKKDVAAFKRNQAKKKK